MARPRKKGVSQSSLLIPEEPKTEWQKLLVHLRANIKYYGAALVFILICAAVAALIQINSVVKDQHVMTAYAAAMQEEELPLRLEKLDDIDLNHAGRWAAEILYMKGETALETNNWDLAGTALEEVYTEYKGNEFAAQAADGLAFLALEQNRLDDALTYYQDMVSQWPDDFTARRAYFKMGELLEKMDRTEEAVTMYRKQTAVFPESSVAQKSEAALERLRTSHPDFFADEEIPDTADAGEVSLVSDSPQTAVLSVETELPEMQ
ncbi:MAG: tetratricopeptide repeat protein [Candidatus Hydrogenedentes bacterium]|jgi:tetratricopeptide (TPR) repeat protein|nr:tetratricopeptide repeat protein [Candidatus Hydrogenedentota bacterium]